MRATLSEHQREQPHDLDPIRLLGEHDLELCEVHLRLMPRVVSRFTPWDPHVI